MNLEQLAGILAKMYENADDGEKEVMIHLFGIKYADEIRELGANANDIIKLARLRDATLMSDAFVAEINKGMKLSKYVVEKETLKELGLVH